MAVTSTTLGFADNKTSGTSIVLTTTNAVSANSLVVLSIVCDNAAAATPTISGITNVGGGTWTARAGSVSQSGASATAGSGIFLYCYTLFTSTGFASGTAITVTFSAATVAKSVIAAALTETTNTLRGTVVSAASTSGAPSVVTGGTAPVTGDIVIGVAGCENSALFGDDTDTLNGAWVRANVDFTTGGSAVTNVSHTIQYKVVTAGGAQTFNPTSGAADSVAIVFTLQPEATPVVTQAAYRFYNDGTESGSTALAAENTAYTADVTGSVGLVDSYTGGTGFAVTNYTGGPVYTGQSFLGNGQLLSKVSFDLQTIGSPGASNLTAVLLAHSGTFGTSSIGTGGPLATSAPVALSSLVAFPSSAWVDFNFDETYVLANGTPYCICLTADVPSVDSSNCPRIGTNAVSPTHPGNKTTFTSVWSFDANSDLRFQLSTRSLVNILLRTRLQLTAAADTKATDDWQLQWEKNANGTWTNVGEVLADSFTAASDASNATSATTTAYGQSFLGNGQTVKRGGLLMRKTGVPTGNVNAQIYAHTGTFGTTSGRPTGSPLTTSTDVVATSLLTNSTMTYFAFDGALVLTNGTPYVLTVTHTTSDASNSVGVGSQSAGGHAGTGCRFASGAWTNIATSTDCIFELYTGGATVIPYSSPSLTDGAATTNRLSAGTGSFVAGEVSETGLASDLGWTASNYTELLYAITLRPADLANGDTLRFRVLRNGTTTDMTYTQTPTINVTKTGAVAAGQPKVYVSGAFTKKPMKVWSGSAWVTKPVKVWTGSAWKTLS